MCKRLSHIRLALNPSSLSFLLQCSIGYWTHKYDIISSGICKWWRRIRHNVQTQLRSNYTSVCAHESVSCMNLSWGQKSLEDGFSTILISLPSYFFFGNNFLSIILELGVEETKLFLVTLNGFLLYSVIISFILFTYF